MVQIEVHILKYIGPSLAKEPAPVVIAALVEPETIDPDETVSIFELNHYGFRYKIRDFM